MSNNYSKWAPPGTKRRRKGWRKRRRERRARLAQEAAERLAASAPTAAPDKRSAPTPARATRSTPAPGHEADEGATASSTRPVPEKLWKNPLLVTGALTVLVIVAITALWGFAYGRPAVRSQGYTGTATNTGVLSEAWASGVDTAWVIPNEKRKDSTAVTQNLLVQGTTLYVASVEHTNGNLTLAAYDIASDSPRQLWVSNGGQAHTTLRYRAGQIIPYGTKLLVGNAIVDGRTGEQTRAPWEDDTAMAAVDDTDGLNDRPDQHVAPAGIARRGHRGAGFLHLAWQHQERPVVDQYSHGEVHPYRRRPGIAPLGARLLSCE